MRRTKTKGQKAPDKDTSEFWMKHDLTEIRRSENNSLREEEKQYFKKFKDKKFNQRPKSKGRSN